MRQQASRTKPTNDEAAPWPSAICSDGAKGLPRERTLEFNTPSRRQRTRTRSQCQHLARIPEGKGTNVTLQSQARKLRCHTPVVSDGDTQRRGNDYRHAETENDNFFNQKARKVRAPGSNLSLKEDLEQITLHHFTSCSPLTSSSESQTCVTFKRCQGLADQ